MGALMRSMDWSKTPIGPVESWSPTLQMLVRLLLANRFQLFLWWGPSFCQIYNDASRPVLGKKHPKSMGQPAGECWTEIWHIIGPLIEKPYGGGKPTWMDDIFLEMNRYGFTEETHFTIAYSPVPDSSVPSQIGGVLGTVHEITQKVLGERRVIVLRDLAARSAEAKTAEEACTIAAGILSQHSKDVPFALLYLVDADRKRAQLAGAAGVDCGRTESPLVVEFDLAGQRAQVWPLAEVFNDEVVRVVEPLAERLPSVPHGPWSDPPHSAVVLPIRSNIAHQLAGLLVLGISSRLHFDDNYRVFCEFICSQVATAIANARAYDDERKRAEALAEIDRAKTAFFSNVSHEFRTPLTLMLGPLEDALAGSSGDLSQQHRDHLTVAHRNALRLQKLVNSLLDFSRLEAGRIEAVYEPTDIALFTAELASTFRSAFEKAGLTFQVDCEPLPDPAYIDRDMWEKIVLNLISNAFKFTFAGKVSVSIRSVGDTIQLQVADTGTGIPDHELPRLFERFRRVEGARGRTYEGTGIGLALVQELAKLHGGSVNVHSREGDGSTFSVSIPKGKSHLPQDRMGGARKVSSSAISADSYVEEAARWLPDEPLEPERGLGVNQPGANVSTFSFPANQSQAQTASELILLADDNSDMRDYLRRLLSVQYRVHAVGNGLDAVRAARELNYDLVLTDVMMPGLDGFGVLKALRSDPATRSKPVILLSARAGEESRVEGLEAGADDYLIKPFTVRELMARVGAHLKMARVRAEAAATERRLRAEADLERTRLRESFAQAPAAMALLSGPDHRFSFVNSAYLHMSGRTRDQVIGQSVRQVFPEFSDQPYFELLDRVYQTGAPLRAGESLVTVSKNGGRLESFYVDFTYHPLRNLEGKVEGIVFQGVDVTEKVLARTQLEQRFQERSAELAHAEENLRTLNHRLIETQEDERKRLARELHDSAGQWLAALKWKISAIQEEIGAQNAALAQKASESVHMVDELTKELRTLSQLLHPPALDEAGLSPALRSYVDGIAERSGLIVELDMDPRMGRLPRDVETAIFRIVQESLTNVHRHAQTKRACVRLAHDSGTVQVEIQDHGQGIAEFVSLDATSAKMGVGLRGMRERVQQLAGEFEFTSGRGGTTVKATLPTKIAGVA